MIHIYKKIEICIFDGFYGGNKAVFDDFSHFEMTKSVSEISEAILKIEKKENIAPLDRIKIIGIKSDGEETIFDGFIREIVADIYFLELKIVDFRQILERKFCLSEKNGISATILNEMIAEWNTKTGENITVEISDTLIFNSVANISAGESFYAFLDTMTEGVAMWDFRIDEQKISIKKFLGKQHTNIVTYSPYHSDNSISEVKATITEKMASRYYITERKYMQKIDGMDEKKYGVICSTSDSDKKAGFGLDRDFEIFIFSDEFSVGDLITLEIIGKKYNDVVILSGWSNEKNHIVGDYISYFGEAFVLEESVIISGGEYEKRLKIGTKNIRKKTLTDILLRVIR